MPTDQTLITSEQKKMKNSKKNKDLNNSFATLTPEKPKQLRSKKPSTSYSSMSKSVIEIPQKYEILVEFYNCMESSIRLLMLKRLLPTFENICSSIQHLTGRRFTYGHLAQLMYILPEAISIRKVLLRDEATCYMKPELQVYLAKEGGYQILRKKFRKRIVKFSRKHPEADVPKEMLPHPFGHQTETYHPSNISRSFMCTTPTNSIVDNHQFVTPASHTGPSFKRHFSKKSLNGDDEYSSLACYKKDTRKNTTVIQNGVNTSNGCFQKDNHSSNAIRKSSTISTMKHIASVKPMFASPFQAYASSSDKKSPEKLNYYVRTPDKLLCTPTAKPDIQASKKHSLEVTCDTPIKEVEKRSVRTRLFGSPKKCTDTNESDDSKNITLSVSEEEDDDDDVISILPSNILQQIKDKEMQTEEERVRVSFKAKKRKEMVASLPKLFDMILLIFQSGSQSSIPKHELVNKLTAGYHSMFDRSEVEQQLVLLQEFVPGWVSLKMVSGASLYSLSKSSVPEEIRQRLAETI